MRYSSLSVHIMVLPYGYRKMEVHRAPAGVFTTDTAAATNTVATADAARALSL